MNNDPFKKMDLNFDPTVEAKVETKNEALAQAEINKQEVKQEEYARKIENENQLKQNQETKIAEVERLAANEYAMKQEQAIISEAKSSQPKDLDKTLEFIIQDEPADSDLKVDEKKAAKKLEKKAYAHKRYSYYWIAILLLSIVFGIMSIFNFANYIMTFVDDLNNEDIGFVGTSWDLFVAFLNSFEAILFIFFISYSIKKYRDHHKPWSQWWIDTEPIRIATALKKEIEINTKHRARANALAIPFTPKVYVGTTNKEELEHFKEENTSLAGLVKAEETRRKQAAKAAKK